MQYAIRHRILFVTIGSGIGVVLVVDGAIMRVMKGVTGDASHIIVDPTSWERCPVGCRGCLETVASARALARAGMQAARDGASPALAQVLRETGHPSMRPIWSRWAAPWRRQETTGTRARPRPCAK